MRWNINLATQPYEDARRFAMLWGGGLLAFALFTALLLVVAARSWSHASQIRGHVNSERARLAQLEAQQERDLAILNQPQNRDVRERSIFLNTLIRRKEFSWTQVFASLERIMPRRLAVVSITPQLTDDDQILVRVMVAGDARDKAIELVRNLEKSSTFRSAQVHSETTIEPRNNIPGGVQFEITAIYVPGGEGSNSAKTQPAGAPSTLSGPQQQARGND
ncbi:MAG: PilN domain-containing protein, partial [Candidatus Korobacteraceae bacterium]